MCGGDSGEGGVGKSAYSGNEDGTCVGSGGGCIDGCDVGVEMVSRWDEVITGDRCSPN